MSEQERTTKIYNKYSSLKLYSFFVVVVRHEWSIRTKKDDENDELEDQCK